MGVVVQPSLHPTRLGLWQWWLMVSVRVGVRLMVSARVGVRLMVSARVEDRLIVSARVGVRVGVGKLLLGHPRVMFMVRMKVRVTVTVVPTTSSIGSCHDVLIGNMLVSS